MGLQVRATGGRSGGRAGPDGAVDDRGVVEAGADDGTVDLERDRFLVERCQAGDRRAFDQLYQRYERRLYRFCLQRVGQPHDAEDVVQEAFARAWRALPRFAGERRFYPWLSVIAGNLCADLLRQRSRLTPMEGSAIEATDPGVYDTEDSILREVDSQLVSAAFSHLSQRHQRVLRLREGSDWSYQRIAEHEGVGVTAVETLLWRARQALKREFALLDQQRGKVGALVGFLVVLPARLATWGRALRHAGRHLSGTVRHLGWSAGSANPFGTLATLGPSITAASGAVAVGIGAALLVPAAPSITAAGPAITAVAPGGGAVLTEPTTLSTPARPDGGAGAATGDGGRSVGHPAPPASTGTPGPAATTPVGPGATSDGGGTAPGSVPASGAVVRSATGTLDAVGSSVGTAGSTVGGVVTGAGGTLGAATGALGSTAQAALGGAGSTIGGTLTGAGSTVSGATGAVGSTLGSTGSTGSALGSTVTGVGSAVSGTTTALGGTVAGTANAAGGAVAGASNAVGSAVDGVTGAVGGAVGGLGSGLTGLLGGGR